MSDVLNLVYETVNDLHECGAVDQATLSQFEKICLTVSDDDGGDQESRESS
jgi:DNA-binding transcriptional regulator YiaG